MLNKTKRERVTSLGASSFYACNFQSLASCMEISGARIDIWRRLLLRMNFIGFCRILNIAAVLLSARSSYMRTMNHYVGIHR